MNRRSTAILMVILVAGCGFLKRPKNEFYSLETIPSETPVTQASGAPIGIDAIELPPGLDRRGMVIRGADHRIEVRGTHQWTAPLEEMVIHTLAFDLANRLPDGMVILPGQPKPLSAMRPISVVFEDLGPGPDGVFILDARWTLTTLGSPAFTQHERITIDTRSMQSADIASAMSRALATLADRIVARLTQM